MVLYYLRPRKSRVFSLAIEVRGRVRDGLLTAGRRFFRRGALRQDLGALMLRRNADQS